MHHNQTCPACGSHNPLHLFRLEDMPVVCNRLWPSRNDAINAITDDLSIVGCKTCGMIWNEEFKSGAIEYTPEYNNALHYSSKFRKYAENLAQDLALRYKLEGETILEIGCGDGYMLDLMSRCGVAKAIGFDPSAPLRSKYSLERDNVEIIPKHFDQNAVELKFDFVICRHVLEHIENPSRFLSMTRSSIGERNVVLYFEVPNSKWILDSFSVWDFIYEHFSYWSKPSIEAAFWRAGLQPVRITEAYDRQFLGIEARAVDPRPVSDPGEAKDILANADAFSKSLHDLVTYWRQRLSSQEKRVVIWGAGSKGITFANLLGAAADRIEALVDLNPRKQGLFAPGIGLPICAPEELPVIAPEIVLVSNAAYLDEVRRRIYELNLDAICEAITPASMANT